MKLFLQPSLPLAVSDPENDAVNDDVDDRLPIAALIYTCAPGSKLVSNWGIHGHSRHPRKFGKIRSAFFEKSLLPFLAFLTHVVKQGGISGEVK